MEPDFAAVQYTFVAIVTFVDGNGTSSAITIVEKFKTHLPGKEKLMPYILL